VRRYEVDERGVITPGLELSFSAFGIGAGYSTRSIASASATKAYLLDDTTLQAIVFDPSAMTVGQAIDLSALKQEGYSPRGLADRAPVRARRRREGPAANTELHRGANPHLLADRALRLTLPGKDQAWRNLRAPERLLPLRRWRLSDPCPHTAQGPVGAY